MRSLQRISSRLSRFGAAVSAVLLVSMLVHTLVEIALRSLGLSTFVLEEMLGYGVAALAFLALGDTLENGGLVRVSVVLARFPTESVRRRGLELVAATGALFVTGLAICFFGASVVRQYTRGYTSGTLADVPMWIPEGVLLLGLFLFWVQLLAHAFRVAVTSARRS